MSYFEIKNGGSERDSFLRCYFFTLSLFLSPVCKHTHTHAVALSLAYLTQDIFASALLKVGCTKPPVEPLLEQQTRRVEKKKKFVATSSATNGRRRGERPFRFSPQQPVDVDPVAGRWFEWRARLENGSVAARAPRYKKAVHGSGLFQTSLE